MTTPHTTVFLLGFIAAFVLIAFLLKTPRRLRRAARVLTAIANALEGRATSAHAKNDVEGLHAATPETACVDPLQADVTNALVQLEGRNISKARRSELAEFVKAAAAANPAANFDVLFRAAVKSAAARPLAA